MKMFNVVSKNSDLVMNMNEIIYHDIKYRDKKLISKLFIEWRPEKILYWIETRSGFIRSKHDTCHHTSKIRMTNIFLNGNRSFEFLVHMENLTYHKNLAYEPFTIDRHFEMTDDKLRWQLKIWKYDIKFVLIICHAGKIVDDVENIHDQSI